MAETEVQRCLDWLLEQKGNFEQSSFGNNGQTVLTASQIHAQNKYKLNEYKKNMEKVTKNNILTEDEVHALYNTYQDVQTLADKRSGCFEVMTGIADLEQQIQGLSCEFDTRAVHLVNMSENNQGVPGRTLSNESMAKATQNCISAVRDNWRWLDEIMQCAHVHLANAATYHQFFQEVDEVEYWMKATMSNIHLSFNKNRLAGNRTDLKDIVSETKDTMLAYLRWQSKVDILFAKSREVVPVNKRTTAIKSECSVTALTAFKSNEIEFKEGETLTLLNNENRSKWQVKNSKDQVGLVPSVILLLNGPSGEAIDAAIRLRVQLLGLWTVSIKRLGYQMIAFMQLVFKDWSDDEIKAIQSMPQENREELKRMIETIDKTLKNQWKGYEGFEELQEKISRMKMILEEADENGDTSEGSGEVVVQFKMLEDLFNQYQEFWTYWETYKVVVELIKQPKYLLVCDKWEQLRFVTTAHFVRFWDTKLELPADGGKTYRAETALTIHETPKTKLSTEDKTNGEIVEEMVSEVKTQQVHTAFPQEDDEFGMSSTDITEIRRKQEMTTDEVVSTTEEMAQSFVIKSVYDPRIDDDLSMEEAIIQGLFDNVEGTSIPGLVWERVKLQLRGFWRKTTIPMYDPRIDDDLSMEEGLFENVEGRYINPITKKSFSIHQAMANGDLTVEFKSQKKIREERSSYGIIKIKTSQETRPYSLTGVVDPKTGDVIPVDKARELGIIGQNDDTYKTKQGDVLDIMVAIEKGHVKADFHGNGSDKVAEETKTYAVNSVVDQRLKQTISFSDAIKSGILDSEHGEYLNNVTNERISITDAIMKGLIKARVVDESETSKLHIDPTNQIVVKRLAKTKQKILRAVKVARAFKTNVPPETNGN